MLLFIGKKTIILPYTPQEQKLLFIPLWGKMLDIYFTQQSQLLDMVPYPTIILCTHTSAGTAVPSSFKFVLESDEHETRRLLAHLGLNYY